MSIKSLQNYMQIRKLEGINFNVVEVENKKMERMQVS